MRRAGAVLAVGAALALGGCGGGGGSSDASKDNGSADTRTPPTRVEVVEAQGGKSNFDAGALYRAE